MTENHTHTAGFTLGTRSVPGEMSVRPVPGVMKGLVRADHRHHVPPAPFACRDGLCAFLFAGERTAAPRCLLASYWHTNSLDRCWRRLFNPAGSCSPPDFAGGATPNRPRSCRGASDAERQKGRSAKTLRPDFVEGSTYAFVRPPDAISRARINAGTEQRPNPLAPARRSPDPARRHCRQLSTGRTCRPAPRSFVAYAR